jgi:hypothetical protein
LETQTVTAQPSPPQENISGQITIPAGRQETFVVHHDPNNTPAGSLSIEVRLFGQIGNSHWWKANSTGPIAVIQSPSIDFSGFPDSVPPGASWQQSFVIRNNASIGLTLDLVTIAEGNGGPQALGGTPHFVPAGGSQAFAGLSHTGIATTLQFTVNANFTWLGGPASSMSKEMTVHVKSDLTQGFDAPRELEVLTPWSFDLMLTNQSTEQVTLRALRHRISSHDFPSTPQIDIPLPTNFSIDPGHDLMFAGVAGTKVPLRTTKIRLEIDLEYDRGSFSFHPDPITKEIHVNDP